MKSAFSFWLGVLLAAAGQPALAQAEVVQTNQLSLNHVLMEVLRQHPSLRAAVADARAAQARVPQERAWEDPMAGVDFERMGTTQFSTYTGAEVMLSQKVPISGRNRWRGKAATAEAGAARAAVQRRELDLLAEARAAYYRYANAHVQLSISDQNQALVRQMIEISRAKYQTGARSQSDVLMAETELAKTEEARRTLELDRAEAESDLNRLMNRSAQGALGLPEPLQLRPLAYDQTALQQEALQRRPEMDEAQWLKSAAQAQKVAARRAWIPEPELRLEARSFQESAKVFDEYDTGVFLNIPWVNRGKYRGMVREAESRLESAEQQIVARRTETLALVRNHLQRLETLRHHHDLFRDRIVPLARQTVEATRLAYTTDRSTFLELLNAQRTLQESESALQQHLTDYLTTLAELEAVVGRPLESSIPKI